MVDLRAPARRGLVWTSLGCLLAALASSELSTQATDHVHRGMFAVLAGSLVTAAAVLQVVRSTMRGREGWT